MRIRLALSLLAIVVLPLGLLGWLGARAARDDRARVEWSLRELAESRLDAADTRIQAVLGSLAEGLGRITQVATVDPEHLRNLVRTTPAIDHIFVLAPDGALVFPPLRGDLSPAETSFLIRTRGFFEHGLPAEPDGADDTLASQLLPTEPRAERSGWYPWYWDSGLHLLYWRRDPSGPVVGVEINRMRLLADIITTLATGGTGEAALASGERLTLRNANGEVVYRWGGRIEGGGETVPTVRALTFPLAAWSLVHERLPAPVPASAVAFRTGGLVIVGAFLAGLAVFLYRETGRELREARQRVRFTNQVSHELRTPLTNIRLYAELLEPMLDEDDVTGREYLGVIVAESQRLSRLINNVLTFARRQRDELSVHPTAGDLDEVVRGVVDQYRPALAARGVAVDLALAAPRPTCFDRDAVEQIVGNLLSNVEKYAAGGRVVGVHTLEQPGVTIVRVADDGPGIPAANAEAVFEPFVRLDDRTTEGVSGTGIGLSIARELARMQGGDLRLVGADRGACFELELPATAAKEPRSAGKNGD